MKLYKILLLTLCAYTLISCGGAEERKAVYLEKAKLSIESGNFDKARIELKNVLQIDPKDAEAYYQLGTVYEQQEQYQKAFNSYIQSEKLNPELLENLAKLGRIYLFLANEPDKAQEKIDFILAKDPENPHGLLLTAGVALKDKRPDDAIEIVKKIIAKNPEHTDSVHFLATVYMSRENYDDAVKVLDTALVNNKDNVTLNKLLVAVLVANKDYDRAEVLYKDFLKRNPNNSASYINLAAFYNQKGDKAKAEVVLREAIENDSDNEDRILTLIRYIREVKGNEEAIKAVESFIAINKGIGRLRIIHAELFTLNDDNQSAVNVLEDAINDFSEEVTGINARVALAVLYIKDKDLDKAAEIVEDAMSVSPNDPEVNFLRAKFAASNNDFEKAIISLRIVTKETPENIEAQLLLANIYQKEGNPEQAKLALNSAYDSNKTNAKGLLILAQYHLSSNIGLAQKIIKDYEAINGADYKSLAIKATVLNQKKEYEKAFGLAAKMMEAYPTKPNGYLQSIPYYAQTNDREGAISVLEKGYMNAKDNSKILTILTKFELADKKFDKVEKRLEAEIKIKPDDVQLTILLAKVYVVTKKFDSARSLLKERVEANTNVEQVYLMLVQLYKDKKDMEFVKEILIGGMSNAKTSILIPIKLAELYETVESYADAINIYKDLYSTQPDNYIVINNLASMLSDYGNGKDDLELAKTLTDKLKDGGELVFLDTIGWVYYKLGDYEKAIQYLSKVVENMSEVNIFNYHLGMAYKMSGDKALARMHLEKSLADNKEFKQKEMAEAALKEL